ncbi:GDSL esterase/lipase 7-like [Humulus lupulus]|uniref:GDSL esterase/lipase 7-like n=1 Tax=Humulus lupulus TaxID=3486 RepID=UPI002B404448|nr:GDSL esterase/lipase 7-like [Humulus lupulus]
MVWKREDLNEQYYKRKRMMTMMMMMILVMSLGQLLYTCQAHKPLMASALYVFGDSLLDSGNNNLLPTLAKANYEPYGFNFKDGFIVGPTGRYTNGRTVADFIAEYLELPYAPPYLSIRGSAALTGLNYASGSCGILPETGSQYGECLNLNDQIDLFQTTIDTELKRKFNKSQDDDLSEYLSKSIFIFSIGNNDYINNYLNDSNYKCATKWKNYSPQTFAQLLVNSLAQQSERLYRLGARKVIVFELGPIGCIPSITRKSKEQGTKCVEEINEMVRMFNQRLGVMLRNLTSSLQGSNFVLGRVHSLGYDAIKNPSKYGLVDTSSACCEAWFNGTSGCIPLLQPCKQISSHYFWDAFHVTETLCSVIANRCFTDSSFCSPTIKELVQI